MYGCDFSLKKFIIFLSLSFLLTSLSVGCNDKKEGKKKNTNKPESSAVEASQEVTEADKSAAAPLISKPELVIPHNVKPAQGSYVVDNAKLLSDEEISKCNDYAEWIYENYLINICIATCDELGELSPYDYAKNIYTQQYGSLGSGMVILINNATNNDLIYKQGRCENIDKTAEDISMLSATKMIVEYNSYGSAIIELIKLAETLPKCVCDNSGVFTPEDINSLEELCGDKNISLLATKNSSEKSDEEICGDYFKRRFADSDTSGNTLIFLNTATDKFTVVTDLTKDYENQIQSCNKLAAAKNYTEACKSMITFFVE